MGGFYMQRQRVYSGPELSGVLFGETSASTFNIRGESRVFAPYCHFLLSPSHLEIVEPMAQDIRILPLTLAMSIIVKSEVAATVVRQSWRYKQAFSSR